jgi:uncharacterized membrane protein
MEPRLLRPRRIEAFDLARGLAVLFMVAVHALQTYATPEVYDSAFGWALEFLGGPPAAPVFMFLMGAVMAFSRRTGTLAMVRRGLFLLALGYALNGLRGSLPTWIAMQSGWLSTAELEGASPLNELLQIDILQFAGMAYLVLAVVRRLTRRPWVWIALAAVVAGISPWIWGRMSGWPILDGLLTLLWGTGGEAVAFPVLPWIVYPLVGMAAGAWLAASDDVGRTFRRFAWAGLGLLVVGGAVTLTDVDFHIGDYWRTGPGGLVAITGFVLLWLSGCNAIASRVLRTWPGRLLAFWSRNVTVFYFIHWILIGWSVFLVGYEAFGILGTLIGLATVVLASDLLTRAWIRIGPSRR